MIINNPQSPKSLEELNPAINTEVKRKRGRPPKDPNAPPKEKAIIEPAQLPPDIPIEALLPLVAMPFSVTARVTKYDGWELTENEKLQLGQAAKVCIDTYLPYILDKWIPIITLIVVAGGLTMGKAKEYGIHKAELEAKKKPIDVAVPVQSDKTE